MRPPYSVILGIRRALLRYNTDEIHRASKREEEVKYRGRRILGKFSTSKLSRSLYLFDADGIDE